MEFKFADLGEGITEGELIKWLVSEGETVQRDQTVAEVETDKAIVEIPSPYAGVVEKLHAQEGDLIKVGQTLITYHSEEGKTAPKAPSKTKTKTKSKPKSAVASSGQKGVTSKQIRRRIGQPSLATPHVRRLAREQGIDLENLVGSGPEGRVTETDLTRGGGKRLPVPEEEGVTVEQMEKWGPVKRVPLKGTRRKIALHMAQAMRMTAPVTHIDEVDVSNLVALRATKKEEAAQHNVKLSFLPFILRAVVNGLKRFPSINASIVGDEMVFKEFYNVGFAVDVEESLFVPVIKKCDQKDFYEIATELQDLSNKARERKIDLADLKGSSFSITNLGSIGGRYFTPIINYPDGAILGIGRAHDRPWVNEGKVHSRPVMSLNLTFDHRVTDGATGARFTNYLIEQLENPEGLL